MYVEKFNDVMTSTYIVHVFKVDDYVKNYNYHTKIFLVKFLFQTGQLKFFLTLFKMDLCGGVKKALLH